MLCVAGGGVVVDNVVDDSDENVFEASETNKAIVRDHHS
jgi:hypothetical protein